MNFKKCFGFSLAIIIAVALITAVNADSVGVNFGADTAGGGDGFMEPTDTAGVVSAANWNNASGVGDTISGLVDDSGAATSADVTWAASESWSYNTTLATTDAVLMSSWISSNDPGVASTVDITGIPYSNYDLYIYTGHDRDPGRTVFTETGGAFTGVATDEDVTIETLAASPFVYNEIPLAGGIGNYFVVSNLTQASLNIEFSHGDDTRAPFAGFQIVQVPEPASALLLGLGAVIVGAIARRRRR